MVICLNNKKNVNNLFLFIYVFVKCTRNRKFKIKTIVKSISTIIFTTSRFLELKQLRNILIEQNY